MLIGNLLRHTRRHAERDARLHFLEELLRGPAFAQEKIFETGAIAAFAQDRLVAEDFGDGVNRSGRLLGSKKRIQTHGEMRLVGEAAADTKREADFPIALRGGKRDVIDLGVIAPGAAAGGGNLEFAGQIVEVLIALEKARNCKRHRRRVDQFVGRYPGHRAAGDVTDDVAAGALGRKASSANGVHNFRQYVNGEPVELNALASCKIGQIASMIAGDAADEAKLRGGEDSVRQADAHHEIVAGEALAALPADGAHPIALGVNTPPLEVKRCPFREYAGTALAGEGTHLIECLPRVLFEL